MGSDDVGILIFIGGAFLGVVAMIVVVAKVIAPRGRPATGADVRPSDDDDDDTWRRTSSTDSMPYTTYGAIGLAGGEAAAGEDPREAEDSRDESDGGWDSGSDSGDSSSGDSGGDSSSD